MIIYRYFRNIITLGIFLVLSLACSTAASSSDDTPDEITRASAARIISGADDFQAFRSISLMQSYSEDGTGVIDAPDKNESREESVKRHIIDYYRYAPQIAIADHLGFVKAVVTRTNDVPDVPFKDGYWNFNDKFLLSDAGKKLWRDFGLDVRESSLPIAVREFVEVTGIIKRKEETIVEYTWRWKTNKMGDALDPDADEFKNLPEKLRTGLTKPGVLVIPANSEVYLQGIQKGRALFRLYDDGWRLINAG